MAQFTQNILRTEVNEEVVDEEDAEDAEEQVTKQSKKHHRVRNAAKKYGKNSLELAKSGGELGVALVSTTARKVKQGVTAAKKKFNKYQAKKAEKKAMKAEQKAMQSAVHEED